MTVDMIIVLVILGVIALGGLYLVTGAGKGVNNPDNRFSSAYARNRNRERA